jgi:hypothetical protein
MLNFPSGNSQMPSFESIMERSNREVAALIAPVLAELGRENDLNVGYSSPIDPNMAYANHTGVFLCPLFTVDMLLIPEELRPDNADDPRLCDLVFLQSLSDWLAEAFHLQPEPVSLVHIAACKTILRLRENPQKFQLAVSAGIAHELGHVILKHGERIQATRKQLLGYQGKWGLLNPYKWMYHWKLISLIKQCEREADQFAATRLNKGVEGIVIGFRTWQASLLDLKQNSALGWRDRILLKVMVSPWGTPLPFYFTHGSFDQRINWAQQDRP